jgi:glycosyltransferase involved in cell wall biosynthesis
VLFPMFARLVSIADMVLTTSPATAEELRALNPQARFLPNAVDARLVVSPEAVRTLRGRPRQIGFLGVISPRTDIDLLAAVATGVPGAELVLVGWIDGREQEMQKVLKLSNVRFMGWVPFDRVSSHIDSFDVCIIPHRDHPLTRSQSALKLYQYLARGKPVVTTPINGAEDLGSLIRVARTREEFVRMVAESCAEPEDDPAAIARRVAAAAANTWDVRVGELWREISAAW